MSLFPAGFLTGDIVMKKRCFIVLILFLTGIIAGCGEKEDMIVKEPEVYAIDSEDTEEDAGNIVDESGANDGKFSDYREAYEAVSRQCESEDGTDLTYNLIDVDGDGTPELAAGKNGYYTSLYTYADGKVYTLMDKWAYGAMGNAGYEYCPGKNSLRNYNTDYAGAILYTTYMTVSGRHTLDTKAEIVTYNFDDVNQNGVPDEEETDSMGFYSVSYIDGVEVTPEECEAYNAGEYEYIQGVMNGEELRARLQKESE